MRGLLIILGLFAALFAAFMLHFHYRGKQLAKARSGMGFDDFAAYFSGEQIPRDKLFAVYTHLQKWQTVENFPVLATDDLYKIYGLCEEDLDSAVMELAVKWRVFVPADFEVTEPVYTVADLVRLLAQLPYGKDDTPI